MPADLARPARHSRPAAMDTDWGMAVAGCHIPAAARTSAALAHTPAVDHRWAARRNPAAAESLTDWAHNSLPVAAGSPGAKESDQRQTCAARFRGRQVHMRVPAALHGAPRPA